MRPAARVLLLMLSAAPGAAPAQQAAAGARAAGMGDAFGAVARGVETASINPANLGLRTTPSRSLLLPAATLGYGGSPIPLRQIDRYGGRLVPDDVKAAWLAAIPAGGAFRGTVAVDLHGIGGSVGRLAFAVGALGHAALVLPRAAAELLLHGNAGREETFTGGTGRFFIASFVSASGGVPIARPVHGGTLAIGGTLKYVTGHLFGSIWDLGGEVTSDAELTEVRLPTVTADGGGHRGIGFDLGVAWEGTRLALGVAVTDLISTFEWSASRARLRDGSAFLSADSIAVDFDERPLQDPGVAPAVAIAARERLAGAVFRPAVRLSAAYRWPRLVLAADLVQRAGDRFSLRTAPPIQLSVGAEYHPVSPLRLRAGAGVANGGGLAAVGAGAVFGPATIDAAIGRRTAGERTISVLSLGMGVAW